MPIPAHFGKVFWLFDPLIIVEYSRDPQKAHPWLETRVMAYRCSDRSRNATWAHAEESKRKKERKETQEI